MIECDIETIGKPCTAKAVRYYQFKKKMYVARCEKHRLQEITAFLPITEEQYVVGSVIDN